MFCADFISSKSKPYNLACNPNDLFAATIFREVPTETPNSFLVSATALAVSKANFANTAKTARGPANFPKNP